MKTLYHLLRIIRLKIVAHAFDGTSNIEFTGIRDFWEPSVRHGLFFSRSGFHSLGLMQSLFGHILFVKVWELGFITGVQNFVSLLLCEEFRLDVAQFWDHDFIVDFWGSYLWFGPLFRINRRSINIIIGNLRIHIKTTIYRLRVRDTDAWRRLHGHCPVISMLNRVKLVSGPPLPLSSLRLINVALDLNVGIILEVVASISLIGLLGFQTCSLNIILLLHLPFGWIHLKLMSNL